MYDILPFDYASALYLHTMAPFRSLNVDCLDQYLYSMKYTVYDNVIILLTKPLKYHNLNVSTIYYLLLITHFVTAGITLDITENLTFKK